MAENKKKVFVAMSGGVDSSVAAALLKQDDNYDVAGAHMICWKGDSEIPGLECSAEKDAEDARRVADKLGIPFYALDFTAEYRKAIFDYMVAEYKAGRTPNPDVLCNKEIKFGLFLKKALSLGADYIATGHYVKIKQNPVSSLSIAKDQNKDQSYFLWMLGQEELRHALFPLGDLQKSEVRALARKFGLPTAEKKDSQGLCFVGQVDFAKFLRTLIPAHEGIIKTSNGKIIGKHDGAEFYTIGQRHGLGIGGGTVYYVAKKDLENNVLIVAEGEADAALYRNDAEIVNASWISGVAPELPLTASVRIRYRQPLSDCVVEPVAGDNFKLKILFQKPQKGVAPGQSAVFYRGEEMLGGGVIA
ncbi:MAG: tRNA 2-thiouridine(34) synthase MnmA [Patescibacteria group bacterium]